jgi:uridine phosphorylase
MMEELIACGMRTLVVTGTAGGLQPQAPIGSLVLATSAIREEGTSHHYAPPDVLAEAHADVVDALRSRLDHLGTAYEVGVSWTTDAIYREHREKVDRYRRAGVASVEMTLSAIYTAGAVRGVRCGAILTVADELHGDEWEIGYGTDAIKRAMVKGGRVALHAGARLAGIEEEV